MKLKRIKAFRIITLTSLIVMIVFELIMDTGCIASGRGNLSLYIPDVSLYILLLIIEGIQLFLVIKFEKHLKIRNSSKMLKVILCLVIPTFTLLSIHIFFQIYMYEKTNGDATDCYYFQQQNYWRVILFLFTLIIAIFVLLDITFLIFFLLMIKNNSRRTPSLLMSYYKYIESVSENQAVIDDIFNTQKTKIELLS